MHIRILQFLQAITGMLENPVKEAFERGEFHDDCRVITLVCVNPTTGHVYVHPLVNHDATRHIMRGVIKEGINRIYDRREMLNGINPSSAIDRAVVHGNGVATFRFQDPDEVTPNQTLWVCLIANTTQEMQSDAEAYDCVNRLLHALHQQVHSQLAPAA
ncbi:MAG: hypothetical protein WCV86_01245 [Patescibacteria group bacterium]|jgi:hypothetical protein